MDNSRNQILRKNNFPSLPNFFFDLSHIFKFAKMRFRGNPRKTPEFHQSKKSSKMVVWGWYMTHFDRRDLLKCEKLVLDRFRNIPVLPDPICKIFRFFRNFHQISQVLKMRFFGLSSPKIFFKNNFHQICKFSLKLWYFSSILVYLHRADSY